MTTQTTPTVIPQKPPAIESGGKIQAIVPRTIEEAYRMADAIFFSGMYPNSYEVKGDARATVSRIMIGIQKSMEVGLAPITGLSTIYIINNRPTIFGDGVPALLYGSGKIKYIKEWSEGEYPNEDYKAICEIMRKDGEEPIRREFSMADAKKAGLLGKSGPWSQYPKRQLQMRARGFAARDGASDILCGLGIAEEVMDIPQPSKTVDTSSLDDTPVQGVNANPANLLNPPDDFQSNLELEPTVPLSHAPILEQRDKLCEICNGTKIIKGQEPDDFGIMVDTIGPCPQCSGVKS